LDENGNYRIPPEPIEEVEAVPLVSELHIASTGPEQRPKIHAARFIPQPNTRSYPNTLSFQNLSAQALHGRSKTEKSKNPAQARCGMFGRNRFGYLCIRKNNNSSFYERF
jgi:hypothetical protein